MIPHISGLFTHWQVHMVCFSETHPDPTSQIYSYASLSLPPPPSPAHRGGAGEDSRERCQISGAAVIPIRTWQKSREAESGWVPCAMFLFTCASVANDAEVAEVRSPLTSLTQHFSQSPCDERRPAGEMQPERMTKTFRLKSSSAESWPVVHPQSESNMNGLLAFFLFPVSCIHSTSEDDESKIIWIFGISCFSLSDLH